MRWCARENKLRRLSGRIDNDYNYHLWTRPRRRARYGGQREKMRVPCVQDRAIAHVASEWMNQPT